MEALGGARGRNAASKPVKGSIHTEINKLQIAGIHVGARRLASFYIPESTMAIYAACIPFFTTVPSTFYWHVYPLSSLLVRTATVFLGYGVSYPSTTRQEPLM